MAGVLKYKFGEFEADLRAAELRKRGHRLRMQMQPFQILVALLERPNDVVTREELRLRLWPEDTFVDFDHGLNTAVAKLRETLGDSAASPKYVETIAKRGYRFLADVVKLEEVILPGAAPTVATTPSVAPPMPASVTDAEEQPQITSAKAEAKQTDLPRASRKTSRTLFVLSQVMYIAFYVWRFSGSTGCMNRRKWRGTTRGRSPLSFTWSRH